MEGVRLRPELGAFVACVLLACALGRTLTRVRPECLPQVAGENVLALVLGDARQQLSVALFDKVEEYFHGGVRCEACDHGLGHAQDEDEHEHGREREREAGTAPSGGIWDPWARLNSRVHVQAHRHLEGNDAVELLPWIWASCRASPKNTQAFVAGSYVLGRMLGRAEEGATLLREGIANNPECAELDFSLGELYMNRLHDAARAEPCFRETVEKCRTLLGKTGGEEVRSLKIRALFYLGYLAKGRGELAALRACVREAEETDPGYVSTKDLRELLRSAEAAGK